MGPPLRIAKPQVATVPNAQKRLRTYHSAVHPAPPATRTLRTGRTLTLVGLAIALAATPIVFDSAIYDNFTLPKQASLLVAAALILTGLALTGEILPRSPWVRAALATWLCCLAISFAFSIDRRGSILGYYQYRQGLLTQLAYLALFLGAANSARWLSPSRLLLPAAIGLGGVAVYTLVQSLGRDPIAWWVDTSERAIGTIGNANELAAYAVIALALGGTALGAGWRRSVTPVAVAALVTFIILESGSRSGLIALAVVAAALPLAGIVCRQRLHEVGHSAILFAAGVVLGVIASVGAGGLAITADRVETGVRQADPGGSTRLELWKGTASTIIASPITGFGPDGLYLAFPRERPSLHGAFDDYDLVAQSSHNWMLDTAANVGLPGLGSLVALVGLVGWLSLRHNRIRADPATPYWWSAMAGYAALTMVNPISMAAHALFYVLLGALLGRAEGSLPHRETRPAIPAALLRLGAVAPAAVALLLVACLLLVADRRASEGWNSYASGEFAPAADHYGSAASLLPFERQYARRHAESLVAAALPADPEKLREAQAVLQQFDADFGFSSNEALAMATVLIGLKAPPNAILPLVERAVELNPHGRFITPYSQVLAEAATAGGTLHYSHRDRWVFVQPNNAAKLDPEIAQLP